MPRAAAGSRSALVGLGVLLGLAYLTRMEAVWLGLTFRPVRRVESAGLALGSRPCRRRRNRRCPRRQPMVAAQHLCFRLAVPGPDRRQRLPHLQRADLLVRRPADARWLPRPGRWPDGGQRRPRVRGTTSSTCCWCRSRPSRRSASLPSPLGWRGGVRSRTCVRRGSLAALLISGALTFVVTSVAFPVATLWGTFEHASGPLLVGLTVAALIGGDAFVAWLVKRRDWQRQNAWLAPGCAPGPDSPDRALPARCRFTSGGSRRTRRRGHRRERSERAGRGRR